jgi:cephalosporin hydroxylase
MCREPEKPTATAERLVREFNELYYDGHVWLDTYWLSVPVTKAPPDLWQLQEIICDTRPELIVETGSYFGGSALFMASICDLLDRGEILSIDIEERERPEHSRVVWQTGSSTDPDVIAAVSRAARGRRTMVVLDSDHRKDHVIAELNAYAAFVTPGCYLIVEDTNVNGRPVLPRYGDGPGEAVEQWLAQHPEFEPDVHRERFLLTFNPGGWLRRRETHGLTE